MKNLLLISLLSFSTQMAFATQPGVAVHPVPKKPTLIADGLLSKFKKKLILPPKAGSQAQKSDEKELLKLQSERTPEDKARTESEIYVSLKSFFGKPYGPLTDQEVEKLNPLFDQLENDADYYIQLLKKEFPRQRPFLYVKGLEPLIARETTGAYPSGHAALSKLYALILSDIFPERKMDFAKRADQIARDRILAGMHHPTDIKAGKKLGELIYKEVPKKTFQRR